MPLTLPKAEAIFDLPAYHARPVKPVNDQVQQKVQADWRSEVNQLDGQIISQYARLIAIDVAVVRTFNLDLVAWMRAGSDHPMRATLDRQVSDTLGDAPREILEPLGLVPMQDEARGRKAGEDAVIALLADRSDVIAFSERIIDDVTAGVPALLILHNVIDCASRQLVAAARASGTRVEIVPGWRSFAIFHLAEAHHAARRAFTRQFADYAAAQSLEPRHVAPRLRDAKSTKLLVDAFLEMLGRASELTLEADRRLGFLSAPPPTPHLSGELYDDAVALLTALCGLLDPRNSRHAGFAARPRATRAQEALARLIDRGRKSGYAQVQEPLLHAYVVLWEYFEHTASFRFHVPEANDTVHVATNVASQAFIGPHAFKPMSEYVFIYRFEAFLSRGPSRRNIGTYTRTNIGGPIDHYVRIWQVVALIEMLFAVLRKERPNETIRWLDLGTGLGAIPNSVRLEDCLGDENWEVVGVDLNDSAIGFAQSHASPRRKFLVGDVRDALREVGAGSFHIISAFEFVEHLEDPIRTLKEYVPLCSDFFVAGSPLGELQGWLPGTGHIWSFDRRGYEEVFRAAGLTPCLSNEAYVGAFHQGHNWVTVVSGANRRLPLRVG